MGLTVFVLFVCEGFEELELLDIVFELSIINYIVQMNE